MSEQISHREFLAATGAGLAAAPGATAGSAQPASGGVVINGGVNIGPVEET